MEKRYVITNLSTFKNLMHTFFLVANKERQSIYNKKLADESHIAIVGAQKEERIQKMKKRDAKTEEK